MMVLILILIARSVTLYLVGLTTHKYTSIRGQTNSKKEETRKLYRTVLLLYGNLKLYSKKYRMYACKTTSRTNNN